MAGMIDDPSAQKEASEMFDVITVYKLNYLNRINQSINMNSRYLFSTILTSMREVLEEHKN